MPNPPSGKTPDPAPTVERRMNIDLTPRRPGDPVLYTGPHLCVHCAEAGRVTSRPLRSGEPAPACDFCGGQARWEP